MRREDIKKALDLCSDREQCDQCPYNRDYENCTSALCADALALVEVLEDEKKWLQEDIDELADKIKQE